MLSSFSWFFRARLDRKLLGPVGSQTVARILSTGRTSRQPWRNQPEECSCHTGTGHMDATKTRIAGRSYGAERSATSGHTHTPSHVNKDKVTSNHNMTGIFPNLLFKIWAAAKAKDPRKAALHVTKERQIQAHSRCRLLPSPLVRSK